jgi:hypothetical protein
MMSMESAFRRPFQLPMTIELRDVRTFSLTPASSLFAMPAPILLEAPGDDGHFNR